MYVCQQAGRKELSTKISDLSLIKKRILHVRTEYVLSDSLYSKNQKIERKFAIERAHIFDSVNVKL